MNKYMKELLKRIKNPGTIITIVSAFILILTNVGIEVNNDAVMNIVNSVCTIGIALGILNNPTAPGVYPFKKSAKEDK